jgi:hypothetical protein
LAGGSAAAQQNGMAQGHFGPVSVHRTDESTEQTVYVSERRTAERIRSRVQTRVAPVGKAARAWAGPTRAPEHPLRVVRVLEAKHPHGSAGRMIISGRMAEVCAEIDRLAALEACPQQTMHA